MTTGQPGEPTGSVNPFLADPSLRPLWQAAAAALNRNGLAWRGRLRLPELAAEGRRRLGVLLEHPIPPSRRSVTLDGLEVAVERLTGGGLVDTLVAVGCAPTGRHEAMQARRDASARRRQALDTAVASHLGSADWAAGWRGAAWAAGLFAQLAPDEVTVQVATVARILEHTGSGRSRSEIAAHVLGDAHALDTSTRLAALVTRALVARDGPAGERAAWERAGMPLDLVSAPVLTWGLPLAGESAPALAARAMTAAGLPLHLSATALRAAPLSVAAGTPILVVENPRLVEAAAERRLPAAVLCTHGNPTTAPTEAIARLRDRGAGLRYHGDFDAAGLAMTGRAQAAGCVPFRMAACDYVAAVDEALATGLGLPRETAPPPPTPWDPKLATEFDARRAIVHEERVMDAVLAAHAKQR